MATSVNVQGFSTNLGLSPLPDIDQTKYPEIFSQLLRLQNAISILQAALDAYTGRSTAQAQGLPGSNTYLGVQNITRTFAKATEVIAYGAICSFVNNAGVLGVRNANATGATRLAKAFCNVTTGMAIGDTGEFILLGYIPITGLTPGSDYFLSTVNGALTVTKPVAAGNVSQYVGFALGTTGLYFNPASEYTQH
jgi:hypothetical protein